MSSVVTRFPTDDIPAEAYEILNEVGVPQLYKGYHMLAYAMYLYSQYPAPKRPQITKFLYPTVAKVFDTLPTRVERDIRTCVEAVFNYSEYNGVYKYFGNSINPHRGKVVNRHFISTLADELHRRLLNK